jgi:hypothetical protein
MRPEYFIGAGAIGVLLLAFVANGRGASHPPKPAPTPGDAHLICQQFVKDRLRSPSTAKFADLNDVKAFKEAGHFTVLGYGDSQNGFGAQVRTRYTCSVEPTTGDKWRLLSLDL